MSLTVNKFLCIEMVKEKKCCIINSHSAEIFWIPPYKDFDLWIENKQLKFQVILTYGFEVQVTVNREKFL
jgi:hypothetical protein